MKDEAVDPMVAATAQSNARQATHQKQPSFQN